MIGFICVVQFYGNELYAQQNAPGASVIMLKGKGKIIPSWTLDRYGLCEVLLQSPVSVSTKQETVELIPMGAARLRIVAFPVVN